MAVLWVLGLSFYIPLGFRYIRIHSDVGCFREFSAIALPSFVAQARV